MSEMSAVFKKLNLKDQAEVAIVNAPATFEPEIASLRGVAVRRSLASGAPVSFSLAFVTKQPEVDTLAKNAAQRTVGDAIVWFAYPKQSSKRYRSELGRDRAWDALGAAGFEPVRMVAIDEDWSAVRFRRVDFIKTLTRGKEHAISAGGRAKAGGAKVSVRRGANSQSTAAKRPAKTSRKSPPKKKTSKKK